MTLKVPAVYENGVLRPLRPLNLPECANVQIQIQHVGDIKNAENHRCLVENALVAAGLSRETPESTITNDELSGERREELAYRFAEAGPVSALIVAERADEDA